MRKLNDTVECGICRGRGTVPLTGVYAETLDMLRHCTGEVTGSELARADGCKVPAMCNRLAVLERYGFAVSRRHGKKRLYRAK